MLSQHWGLPALAKSPLALAQRGCGVAVGGAASHSRCQLLANLVSNAYKFSPSGTPVTVTVREVDGRAELTVHDEGPGIPPDRAHELFNKFGRLGRALQR